MPHRDSTCPSGKVVIFTLENGCKIGGRDIPAKTAVALSEGDTVRLSASENARLLFLQSKELHEPIAWGGPIVMNTQAELREGTFLKEEMKL